MIKLSKGILACMTGLFIAFNALAVTPSPAMIEQFKQLPPEQQQQLAAQYGIDLSQISNAGAQGAQAQTPVEQLTPTPRAVASAVAKTDDEDGKLARFGTKMFDASISTFAPVNNMPVPDDYVLGADDSLNIQLYGKETSSQALIIDRDGMVQLDGVGPVQLAGLTFAEASNVIKGKITEAKIGVEAAVSMGKLRTINIFIAGEAKFPGMYAVSAMTTVTQALFVAGGVSEIGSLRDIRINRSNKQVGSFDLYELLLSGNNQGDIHLKHGDVLFVAPVKAQVTVTGLVNRPAIYEVKSSDTIGSILKMAGGAKPNAHLAAVSLERINNKRVKDLQTLDLTNVSGLNLSMKDGDVIAVKPISNRVEHEVSIEGAVVRPGRYAYVQGMQLSSLINSQWADLHQDTNLDYALLVREYNGKGDIQVIQFNLAEALGLIPGKPALNLVLQARDQILVFNQNAEQRQTLLQPVLDRLKLQATKDMPQPVVAIRGQVKMPGNYPIGRNTMLKDLFVAAGGLTDSAFVETVDMDYALLVREVDSRGTIEVQQFSLAEQFGITTNSSQQLMLKPQDQVLIFDHKAENRKQLLEPVLERLKRQSNAEDSLAIAAVSGQVKFPGEYPVTQSLTISSLVLAAGGLTDAAFTARAELSRTEGFNEAEARFDIKNISVNLANALNKTDADIKIESRDRLNIFTKPEWAENRSVVIAGEVRFPGTYQIARGEKLSELIARAGGFTEDAFPFGAVFTREKVKEREQLQFNRLLQQLRADIAAKAVTSSGTAQQMPTTTPEQSMALVKQLESTEMVGRLSINMTQIEAGNPEFDVVLEQGDRLLVPRKTRSVTVIGEVQYPSSHSFDGKLSIKDYLALAGNPRKRADEDRVYVVRADGSVIMPNSGMFLMSSKEIVPGDTIVVPLDVEYKDSLSLWGQISQIAYQTAIAVAALNSL